MDIVEINKNFHAKIFLVCFKQLYRKEEIKMKIGGVPQVRLTYIARNSRIIMETMDEGILGELTRFSEYDLGTGVLNKVEQTIGDSRLIMDFALNGKVQKLTYNGEVIKPLKKEVEPVKVEMEYEENSKAS